MADSIFGSGGINAGATSTRAQAGGRNVTSNGPAQKYDGVNEAISGENKPMKEDSIPGSLDALYRSGHGVQPYPRRNQPPNMGGGPS